MYQTNCRCIRPLPWGTSTWIMRIGLNEYSRFQIVRRSKAFCDRSYTVDDADDSLGSYFESFIDSGNSTRGRGPLNISSACGAGGIVVSTPGANVRPAR